LTHDDAGAAGFNVFTFLAWAKSVSAERTNYAKRNTVRSFASFLFLVNVLHNAIKYSSVEETVQVSVRNGGGQGSIDIQDHGPGIPPEDQPHVFDRFYRVDRARWRRAARGWGCRSQSGQSSNAAALD
jgi:hypothetical protein